MSCLHYRRLVYELLVNEAQIVDLFHIVCLQKFPVLSSTGCHHVLWSVR